MFYDVFERVSTMSFRCADLARAAEAVYKHRALTHEPKFEKLSKSASTHVERTAI